MPSDEVRWTFADNWHILLAFLGTAIAILALGVLAVLGAGADAAPGAGVLLSLGVFLVVFAVLLLVPRLTRRGAKSYRLVVDRPIEEVEQEVRGVLESGGRKVTTDVVSTRSPRPPRVLTAEGAPWRIRLERVSRRESGDGVEQTEVVQVGVGAEGDAEACAVRDVVAARLSASGDAVS